MMTVVPGGTNSSQRPAERLERRGVAAEGQPDDVFPFLLLGQPTLDVGVVNRGVHARIDSKIAPNGGAVPMAELQSRSVA